MTKRIIAMLILISVSASVTLAGFPRSSLERLRAVRRADVGWTPAALGDDLVLWLDGSDPTTLWADTGATTSATNNGLVARWDDKSGNGWHMTQATEGSRPTYKASELNDNGVVDFPDGKRIFSASLPANQGYTIMMVLRINTDANAVVFDGIGSANAYAIFRRTAGGGGLAMTAGSTLMQHATEFVRNEWTFAGGVVNGASSVISYKGITTEGDADTGSVEGIRIGINRTGAAPMIGLIAEKVWADTTDSGNRQKMEGYLAHKWGLADNLPAGHPYKDAAP